MKVLLQYLQFTTTVNILVGTGFKPSDFPIQDGSLSGQGSQDLFAA
jgi:hypothetical protein